LGFVALLLDLQSTFDALIRRCPGRTLAQRRGVFLRLQRVCNYMESTSDLDLGIAGFARVANYSPCHFVRTFNSVYGETPHAVLIEQRLKRALRLVNDTELSITEVARASGFEDRCAFARSFKRRFGETATAVRERSQSCEAVCE
jgi:AraC family transcriptional regulator